jgi:hypothetical protein
MASKINVLVIFSKHLSTLKGEDDKLLKQDKRIFILLPFIIAVLMISIIRIPSDNLTNFFTLTLSLFIGLFLNLLVLIISFSENKLKIKDEQNRKELLTQTFYNIAYTILISLVGLGIVFLGCVDFLPSAWSLNLGCFENKYLSIPQTLNFNRLLQLAFFFIFYAIFVHLILTLLMVIKRIFSLFNAEIEHINKNKNEEIENFE